MANVLNMYNAIQDYRNKYGTEPPKEAVHKMAYEGRIREYADQARNQQADANALAGHEQNRIAAEKMKIESQRYKDQVAAQNFSNTVQGVAALPQMYSLAKDTGLVNSVKGMFGAKTPTPASLYSTSSPKLALDSSIKGGYGLTPAPTISTEPISGYGLSAGGGSTAPSMTLGTGTSATAPSLAAGSSIAGIPELMTAGGTGLSAAGGTTAAGMTLGTGARVGAEAAAGTAAGTAAAANAWNPFGWIFGAALLGSLLFGGRK
jgi:hypothetical protein